MNDELLFIQLRDCFTAGYTMPQFCIDNGIRKPLFVAPGKKDFLKLWEIYLQFKYDKRLFAKFTSLDSDVAGGFNSGLVNITGSLRTEKFSDINFADFDTIIILGNVKVNFGNNKEIYLERLVKYFIHHVYFEIPILHFLQKYPQTKIIITDTPRLKRSENNSEREKKLLDTKFSVPALRDFLRQNKNKKIVTPYDFLGYNNRELFEILETPAVKVKPDGSTVLTDNDSPLIQIHKGRRDTPGQPDNFRNTVYFFGHCVHYGFGVPVQKTVTTVLQSMFNENNLPYRVENRSQTFWSRCQDIFYNLNKLTPEPGDIIFIDDEDTNPPEEFNAQVPFFSVRDIFVRPHDFGEVFGDDGHINELGHKALAEKLFEFLTQNNFFRAVEPAYPPPRSVPQIRHTD